MNVLITGANGFIGRHLTKAIIDETDWNVVAVDLRTDKVRDMVGPGTHEGRWDPIILDVRWATGYLRGLVHGSDVVIPLAAIATPKTYVQDPLSVFELDFGANLNIVRWCAEHGVRLVFPSSSEVYGKGADSEMPFEEDRSPCVYGPTKASRWIYACCKQLLERVIIAFGRQGLRYTIFRPFNWIGPGLDSLAKKNAGTSRVVTAMLGCILRGEPVKLVNGGMQKRCFTWVGDGVGALMSILKAERAAVDGQIFNIGAPKNEVSIRGLARRLWDLCTPDPLEMELVTGEEFYGSGYEDIQRRVPDITRAQELLGWEPVVGLDEALERTVAWAKEEVNREG